MLQEGFPFPVQIRVNGKTRKPVVQGNQLLIPLRVGDVYDVVVENHQRPGERTTLVFDNMRRIEIGDDRFTREGILPFRDAALALTKATGRQATVEELLERMEP